MMRVPWGGRMGIPKCGGMHGVQSEYLCYDCKSLSLKEREVVALETANKDKQWELEQDGRPPRPRYTPPPPPEKTKNNPGGMNVRPRSINVT